MKDVRKIKIEDTYALRHQILRPHQTIDQCRYPGDFDELTAHLGIFEADELVGILSIYKVQNNDNNKWTVIVREEALVSCLHFRRMIEQGCYSV
jgi:hypothetical protein